jgi:phosphatidylserine/phosphatidylglycerophosphate/cardiolipin synthase-like enzyme
LERKSNNILTNTEFRDQLIFSAANSSISLTIYSAFIKINALNWLLDKISNIKDVKIVVRWTPQDLAFKASDLGVYELCKQNGWQFGIDNSLHSKAFIFDSKTVLLGSANLTDRGLSLSRDGNLEMGAVIEPTIADLKRLNELEKNVTWMDDALFEEIKEQIDILDIEKPDVPSWTSSLKNKLSPVIDYLWISELLHSKPEIFEWPDLEDLNIAHDIDLLSLSMENIRNKELIKEKFLSCREYRWFKQQLDLAEEGTYTNFGWLTDKLHDAILDDPPPYRVGVKEYASDFEKWLKVYAKEEIKITKFERTSGYSLIK